MEVQSGMGMVSSMVEIDVYIISVSQKSCNFHPYFIDKTHAYVCILSHSF